MFQAFKINHQIHDNSKMDLICKKAINFKIAVGVFLLTIWMKIEVLYTRL